MSDKKTGNNIHTIGTFSRIEKMHPFKTFLFFAMVGSTLIFLSLVFVYIIKVNNDSINAVAFKLPKVFTLSTILLLLSSFSISQSARLFKGDRLRELQLSMLATLFFATGFCITQFLGWKDLFADGYFLSSAPGVSFLYMISAFHLLHVILGMGSLIYFNLAVMGASQDIVRSLLFFSNKAHATRIELFSIFWHFTDFLWVTLFLMFLFTL